MKIALLSFSTDDWSESIERAKDYNDNQIFYKKILLTQSTIEEYVPDFYFKNRYIIDNYKEYPFMGNTWKSDIIKTAFEKEKDVDFFLYSDSGNEFNINSETINRFYEYFSLADDLGILSMINRDSEKTLSHCSVINRIYPEAANTNQRNTGTLFIKNNKKSLDVINEWDFYIKNNNYENIITSNEKCCNYFYKNLYDQSVLSCVLKKNKIAGIPDELDWYFESEKVYDSLEDNLKKYPIFNARNKNKYSLLNKCVKYHNSAKHIKLCNKFGTNEDCFNIEITRKV
jgi:hypothetical protein